VVRKVPVACRGPRPNGGQNLCPHQHSCGFESEIDFAEASTQWVRNKISPFSSRLRKLISKVLASPPTVVCFWCASWMSVWIERALRREHPGRPARQDQAVAAPGSAATVHLQSLGRIRGPERCGAAFARSDVPLDRLGEDLGGWGRVAFAPPYGSRPRCCTKPRTWKVWPNQSGPPGEGGGHGFTPAGRAGYGKQGNPRLWRTGAECLQRAF
jgi:hypothetical protein